MAQQVGMRFGHFGAVVVQEQRHDAALDLAARCLDAVDVTDLEPPDEDVT